VFDEKVGESFVRLLSYFAIAYLKKKIILINNKNSTHAKLMFYMMISTLYKP
jgi:hypothetical protein